jgi:hypothetical protein
MNDAMNQAINGLAIYAAVILVVGCGLALYIGHRRRQLAPLVEAERAAEQAERESERRGQNLRARLARRAMRQRPTHTGA